MEKHKVGVIGLGYTGLPLCIKFAERGRPVIGFDVDQRKIDMLSERKSYINHVSDQELQALSAKAFDATSDMRRLAEADSIIISVPTPITDKREPDLRCIISAAQSVAASLRQGQLIVLESTTYPGTTRELVLPMLESTGLVVGRDFYLAYSPERCDPGNKRFNISNTPKLVGGITPGCTVRAFDLFSTIVDRVIPVASPEIAEAAKLLENTYRAVNIALVNELKMVLDRMNIDIWDVIDAASTKPFGFQPFYPGPGIGGHCIPVDPFYLSWKAREVDFCPGFIEHAGQINARMPYYVVDKVGEALNSNRKSINGSRILVLGVAYKRDVDDIRESPALKIIEILISKGALVDYHDPNVAKIPKGHHIDQEMHSVPIDASISSYDCVVITTDHSSYDYKWIHENAKLIVDTRNVIPRSSKVIRS